MTNHSFGGDANYTAGSDRIKWPETAINCPFVDTMGVMRMETESSVLFSHLHLIKVSVITRT